MKKTTYQTQKSTPTVEKRESQGVIDNKAKASVKKLEIMALATLSIALRLSSLICLFVIASFLS